MKKNEFRELVERCMNQFGETMKIADVTLNEGAIYNPRVNEGRAVIYVGHNGKSPLDRVTDIMWSRAKKEGSFTVGDEEFDVYE